MRTGAHVLKALALGAECVFVGRPILWANTVAGEKGVRKVLEILNKELEEAMLACGINSVEEARGNQSILLDRGEYLFKL